MLTTPRFLLRLKTCVNPPHQNNAEVNKVSLWVYRDRLTLKILKTNYMIFQKTSVNLHATLYSLTIGGSALARVFKARSLGVKFDPCS